MTPSETNGAGVATMAYLAATRFDVVSNGAISDLRNETS